MQIFYFHPDLENTPNVSQQGMFAPVINHAYNSSYLRLALGMGMGFVLQL